MKEKIKSFKVVVRLESAYKPGTGEKYRYISVSATSVFYLNNKFTTKDICEGKM